MAFAGLRGTGDWGVDERPKNFREMILWRNPNGQAPLTALMSKMKTEKTDDPEFSWWEEQLDVVKVIVDGAQTSGDTALELVSGGLKLVIGDLLLVSKTEVAAYDNELVEVTAVASDTAITIARGAAGSSAAAMTDLDTLTKIGNVFAEGTVSPTVTNENPVKLKNFAQIFKTAYELTGTVQVTRARTGDPLKNDKKRKMFQHSVALEMAYLFGKNFETTGANGKPKRYLGGLREFITTNAKIYTTGVDEDGFLDDTFKVFDFDSGTAGNERLVFAGNGYLNNLNKLAKNASSSRINFDSVVRVYGMELQRWILPQGTFFVRSHPLMNTHPIYTDSAFFIDPSAIVYRPLRDTKPEDNIQANDADTRKGQWMTEAGIEVRHEGTMAYHGNFIIL
ncbi:MAG: hypothetical protein E2O82_05125 [Betaproteobacteria bacterium]|nr:MAG: hypothetical protein E2O82_05125 [Betaproteobacteria bacterium]